MILSRERPLEKSVPRNDDQSGQQLLPFLDQPSERAIPARVRAIKFRGKRHLQDILWKESLLAVRVSLNCQNVAELISRLQEKLPQNSLVTRRRNTSIIRGRFFPTNDLDQLPRHVLRAYDDEALLAAVMRVLFLEAELLVGKLVADLVRQILQQAKLVTVDVRLSDYDGPAQLGQDPKELEDAIAAFRSFLTRKLEGAQQAHPGKIVRLNLKHG